MTILADLDLARRIEAADAQGCIDYARAWEHVHPEANVAIEIIGGMPAVYSGPGAPVNRIVGLGLHGPVTQADIERVEDFYRSRSTPVQIDLCPLVDRSLIELLGARGYCIMEANNVLVRQLSRDESFPLPPEGMVVRPIEPQEIELWARTVSQGFDARDDAEPGISLAFPIMQNAYPFLACITEQPAGGGVVAIHKDLAVLFSASTRVAFRNRGVQTALVYARLAFAATQGCNLAVTYTFPDSDSQRNVERQGFGVVYTKMTMTHA